MGEVSETSFLKKLKDMDLTARNNLDKIERFKVSRFIFSKLVDECKYISCNDVTGMVVRSLFGIPIEIIEDNDWPDDCIVAIYKIR